MYGSFHLLIFLSFPGILSIGCLEIWWLVPFEAQNKVPTPRDDMGITGFMYGYRLYNFDTAAAGDCVIKNDSTARILVTPNYSDLDSNVNELKSIESWNYRSCLRSLKNDPTDMMRVSFQRKTIHINVWPLAKTQDIMFALNEVVLFRNVNEVRCHRCGDDAPK